MIHQPVFDIRNFECLATEKLTHYYVICQGAMNELQRRHNPEALAPYYETARDTWGADPSNPKKFPPNPLTEKVVKDFYAICDTSCDSASSKTSKPECVSSFQRYRSGFLNAVLTLLRFLRTVFAANNDAQFIRYPR